jgi:Dolichyl-phosphate-mannose-protein mannosyltransferase
MIEGNVQTASPEITQPATAAGLRAGHAFWSFAAAALLAAFYLATSIYVSAHRLLWFDEVVTVHIARLPDWKTILTALSHGTDSLPPLYYLVVRMFGKMFGHVEVAVRLPSTLAMVATLLITFDCARRLTDGLHGLIAMAIAAWPLAGEGFEARSYAIYVMFAALALWVWTYTGASERVSAILFGATLFLAVSFHYYAVLLLAPYAAWEIARWKPWQRPSLKLIAGIVGVGIPAMALSHFILSFSRKFAPGFWSRPSLRDLTEIYSHIFVNGLFVIALTIVWIVLTNKKQKSIDLQPMPEGEAIGWLFLCIPLAGFVAAELKTNAFAVRYFLALVPGVAVAFACWTWRHFHIVPRVSFGIFLIVAAWGLQHQLQITRHWQSVETPGTRDYLGLESTLQNDGKHFFVFSDPFQFLEAQYYSAYPGRCILLLPSEFQKAIPGRSFPDPYMHQRVEVLLSQYYPLQLWRLDQIRGHAQETALIKPTREVVDAMKRVGLEENIRFFQPVQVMYLQ